MKNDSGINLTYVKLLIKNTNKDHHYLNTFLLNNILYKPTQNGTSFIIEIINRRIMSAYFDIREAR